MYAQRWVRHGAWTIGALAGLLVLAVALLHLPQTRRLVMQRIAGILREQGIGFDASRFEYNLLALSTTLNDVSLRSPSAPDLPPFLQADQVRVELSLRRLIQGDYYVKDALIRNPRLNLVIDANGRDNLPRPPQREKPQTHVEFLIDHLLITGGQLRYEDRRLELTTELPLLELTIDGNPVTMAHDIRISSRTGGLLVFRNRTLPVMGLTGDLLLSKDSLNVRKLELALGDSTVALSGTLKSFDDPNYDLKAETVLALGSLVEFAGVPRKVAGNLHVSLATNGTIGRLKARARLQGDDLTVEQFDRLGLKAEAAYDAETSRVRLESLNVTSPSGSLRGEANLALTPKAGQSTANISASNVDLARISRTLRLPVLIASRATADVAANWPALEFAKAAGGAALRLAATRSAPAPGVLPVSGAVNARSEGTTVHLDIAHLTALSATVSGRVSLKERSALAGELRLSAPDLTSAVGAAEAYLGKPPGGLVGTPIQGTVNGTATLGGTLQAPAAEAKLTAPQLKAGALDGIHLSAGVNYTPALVVVDNLTLRWREQGLTASGTIGLAGRDPSLHLKASTRDVAIETILAGLDQTDVPVSGGVELNAEISGTTENPRGDVHLTATDLSAYNEPLGALTAEVRFEDQVAHLSEFTLSKPQPQGEGALRITGAYDINGRTYAVQAESSNLHLNSLTLPGAVPVRAALQLQASGQGTLENPGLDLHLTADRVQLRERPLGTVDLTAKVAGRKSETSLKAPKFGITATTGIGTQKPYPANFELHANNTNLQDLPVEVDPGWTGTVSATVRGKGELENYRKGEATAEVSSLNVAWRGQPVRAGQPLRVRYHNEALTIEQATLTARESRISLKGELPLDRAGSGAIELSAKLDLPTLAPYIPSDKPIEAKGQATIDGTIRGNLQRIDPNVNATLTGGSFLIPGQKFPVSDIDVSTTIAEGAVQLHKASARFGPASFAASGTFPLGLLPPGLPVEFPRRQGPAQVEAELKSLDLASLPDKPEMLAGTVSARLNVQSSRADLHAISGKLSFPELRLHLGTYRLEQKGTSEIEFANGTARISQFNLTGPETELRLAGTAGLTGQYPLDLRADGKLDASIASAFTDAVRVKGATEIQAAVTGTAQEPQARGHVQISDGQLTTDQPRVGVEHLNLRLELAGQRLNVAQLDGTLNGGTLSGGGGVEFARGELRNSDLNLKADGVYMDFPEGLKTVSNVALSLQNKANEVVLGGRVSILEGGFTDDLHFDRGILAAVTAPRGVELTEERNKLLEKVRLSIRVQTQEPLVIDNNLAKAEITADLRAVGTPYEPGLSGRMEIAEEGELRLQERRYVVERGIITFTNERRIEPSLDLVANTTAAGHDIRLEVSGEPGKTTTKLTSDPELPEPDIMSLLITGRKMDELRGDEFAVAGNQMLSYLTGRLGSQLGRGLEQAMGLSTVRIEPNLIAAETDPGARLTVGQNITRNLDLIYSMDLMNSSDQIYVAEYDLSKRFTTRGVWQSDGSFRFDFNHDLRFGGIPEPRRGARRQRLTIGHVEFTGEPHFPQRELEKKFRVEAGDRYDFFKVRKGLDRVNRLFAHEGMVESNVRLKRVQRPNELDLSLDIKPGPKVNFVFEGIDVPGKVRNRVREVWGEGVFDSQRAEDSRLAIREWLVRDRYLQGDLKHTIDKPAEDTKRVVFDIQPGPRFEGVKIEFDGAKQIESGKLRDVIDDQKMSVDVYTRPRRVSELLTRFYHEMGYLDAEVDNPRYELDPQTKTGRVTFPVTEGPLYRVGKVEFTGNTVFTGARLAEAVPLPLGENYRPVLREHALQRLKDLYWDQGYTDVDAEFVLNRHPDNATADIAFRITENRKSVTRDVAVVGNDETSENMIRTQLEVKPGDPLSLQKLSNSRRNLYRTGAYSLIDILRQPAEGFGTGAEAPVNLRVRVREVQPFQLRYGGFFDTERGPGAILDFSNHNSLGSARVLGLRARYDSQLREGRIYFSQPTLLSFPGKTIASPYLRSERNPATDEADAFNVDRVGFSLQQELAFRKNYLFTYGYRIERSRTYDAGPEPIFDILLRVASLTSTLTRETRDDILDATRGGFLSHAIEWSPSALGSQVRFMKYFGQYFRYFPLQKPRIELFTNEVLRPRLVYAAGARVGLAKGFGGQEVPLSERFFAGGSNSIRGFEQNSVGPIGADREPRGGAAMLVINNEIRFPLIGIFDGVGFVDVGNVYPAVTDFSLADIRKAAGVGLRVRTPWFLLRLDYGVKLDRRAGESRGRLFFSIGQAF